MRRTIALAACALLAGTAQARVYGFIDNDGVAHFSNVPNDPRYKLFMNSRPGEKTKARAGKGSLLATPARLQARRQAYYRAQVADVALSLRLDAALVHAVIAAESGYNARARSPKGAMGLMQLMPETARRYCVTDPYDPAQNLRGGSRYLRDLLDRYDNDLQLALAAYNAGEGAVARHGNRIPPYQETRDYVPRVLELYEHYRRSKELAATTVAARSILPAGRNSSACTPGADGNRA